MFQNLGRTLTRLRIRAGKSQAAIARAAGMGKSQYRSLKPITVVFFLRNIERRMPWHEPRSRQKVLA